jgi:hypothetical protein
MNTPLNSAPAASVAAGSDARAGSFRLYRHVLAGLAIALIAPFTALAWPFATLLGIVIGRDEVERQRGVPRSAATTIVRVLAVSGGVLAMLYFGAIIGGLISFLIAALAYLSEKAAADAETTDRVVVRILLFVMPLLSYVLLMALGATITISAGA